MCRTPLQALRVTHRSLGVFPPRRSRHFPLLVLVRYSATRQRSPPVLAELGKRLPIQLAQVSGVERQISVVSLPCLDREICKPSKKCPIPAPTSHMRRAVYRDVAGSVRLANAKACQMAQTGEPGTIFLSAAMGGHGRRAKYFLQPGSYSPLQGGLRLPAPFQLPSEKSCLQD